MRLTDRQRRSKFCAVTADDVLNVNDLSPAVVSDASAIVLPKDKMNLIYHCQCSACNREEVFVVRKKTDEFRAPLKRDPETRDLVICLVCVFGVRLSLDRCRRSLVRFRGTISNAIIALMRRGPLESFFPHFCRCTRDIVLCSSTTSVCPNCRSKLRRGILMRSSFAPIYGYLRACG